MNARMKQQGGWAGSFVIVGILLALLLVGGVYFLKSNQAQDGNIADISTEEKSTGEKSQKNGSDDRSRDDRKQSSEEDELPSGGQDVGDSEEQQNLPQTGPSDTIAASMILGLVAYSGAAYIRSRGHSTL